jgi:hypothetical protein
VTCSFSVNSTIDLVYERDNLRGLLARRLGSRDLLLHNTALTPFQTGLIT